MVSVRPWSRKGPAHGVGVDPDCDFNLDLQSLRPAREALNA